MKKYAIIFAAFLLILGVGIYSFFWYISKQPSKSEWQNITLEDVEKYKASTEKAVEEYKAKQNLPTKISPLPSIGATREEFLKTFSENARNGNDYIRYNNDGILVTFGSDGRAIIVSLQPLAENNYLKGINPRDFLPSDTVQIDEKKTKLTYEAKGTSELLRQVYPASQGKFGAGAMYKDNGDVISVTISVF